MIEKIKKEVLEREKNLSKYACCSKDVIRLKKETEDLRPAFFHDCDRIIYSLSYSRYIDKTQVFSYESNDHVSHRMIHVQFVSKIARTIGRMLKLNEDLIEAAALGHDLGHTPLGHLGESILNKISLEELGEYFMHNLQSVRVLMNIDKDGEGSNISVQVLDAIMCHNGEELERKYQPRKKTSEDFLKEYQASYKDKHLARHIEPMTLEGCVVRIADVIGYIGRDIEDAIQVGIITREDLPDEIVKVLGDNNSKIINTIVLDIIENSYGKNYIALSDEVYEALEKLKAFNYEKIYYRVNTNQDIKQYELQFRFLFERYLYYLNNKTTDSIIYSKFLKNMSKNYLKTDPKRIALDFISGMTDDYFLEQYNLEKKINLD